MHHNGFYGPHIHLAIAHHAKTSHQLSLGQRQPMMSIPRLLKFDLIFFFFKLTFVAVFIPVAVLAVTYVIIDEINANPDTRTRDIVIYTFIYLCRGKKQQEFSRESSHFSRKFKKVPRVFVGHRNIPIY